MPTVTFQSPLPVSPATLFAWHERPGAFERLAPPWERIRVLSRRGSIHNGDRLVMQLSKGPLRLQWHALHGPSTTTSFQDTQTRGPFASWHHLHEMLPGPTPDSSTLRDTLTYRLPAGPLGALLGGGLARHALERMFAFRHARTRADLLRHADAALRGLTPRRILLSGASGLIGRALEAFLTGGGHRVDRLVRRKPAPDPAHHPAADPAASDAPAHILYQPGPGPRGGQINDDALEGADAVIHLAGEPIAGRWTPAKKAAIRDSRVDSTRLIARALANLNRRPSVLIVASGIGFYGDRADQELVESAGAGSGFLAEVARDWEAAAEPARQAGIRVVHLRLGLVLTPAGGLLAPVLPLFRLGLGAVPGTGTQWWSWIGLDDVLGLILHTLATDTLRGPINAVAPVPVTAREFAATLAHTLDRPLAARVPTPLIKLPLGEAADMLLPSTRAVPDALRVGGFRFQHPTLAPALRWELGEA